MSSKNWLQQGCFKKFENLIKIVFPPFFNSDSVCIMVFVILNEILILSKLKVLVNIFWINLDYQIMLYLNGLLMFKDTRLF